MHYTFARDPRAIELRHEIDIEAMNIDVDRLKTAVLYLWDVDHAGSPGGVSPRVMLDQLLRQIPAPLDRWQCPDLQLAPWVPLDPRQAADFVVALLVNGETQEPAVFDGQPEAAAAFVGRLFDWLGAPLVGFASWERQPDGGGSGFSIVSVPHWTDAGIVLVGPTRVGLVLFLGTD